MDAPNDRGAAANEQGAERDMTSGEENRKRLIVFTPDPNTDVSQTDVSQIVSLLLETTSCQSGSVFYKSDLKEEIWESFVDEFIVLYHPYSAETPLPDLSDVKDFLDYYREQRGLGNINVVISDVKDINSERQIIARWMEGEYRNCELLTLRKEEMEYLTKHKINPLSVERRMANKLRHIHHILKEASGTRNLFTWYLPGSHTVGIFSRSSESDYEWLTKQLKSEPFRNTEVTVLPHYISNNGGQQFREAVSRCTFGILYHTKKRGRINIVDVTDSLYDEELKYLCEHLGKEKVIVVVDDLEDASSKEKDWILEAQPSIGSLAKDLFLFSEVEKNKTEQCLLGQGWLPPTQAPRSHVDGDKGLFQPGFWESLHSWISSFSIPSVTMWHPDPAPPPCE